VSLKYSQGIDRNVLNIEFRTVMNEGHFSVGFEGRKLPGKLQYFKNVPAKCAKNFEDDRCYAGAMEQAV